MLILKPLTDLLPDESANVRRIIIIDALDECARHDHISRILSALSQLRELRTTRLRVFSTSRATTPIVDAFQNLTDSSTAYHSLALHKEFYEETKADISAYLKGAFTTIKTRRKIKKDPWPDPNDMDRLITLATTPSPLFIYASTLCRFVDDGTGKKPPTQQLKRWLKQCDSNASRLNQIYLPILRDLFSTAENGGKS